MTAAWRVGPIVVLLTCSAAMLPLRSWVDATIPDESHGEEDVYVTDGKRAKLLAVGYDSLLSDVYWVRAIQFFGRRVLVDKTVLSRPEGRLDQLYPLIDVSTTLDPRTVAPYRFGGFFVHDYVDKALGRHILEKGVRANPDTWRLYQDLAFLYWSDGDCETASRLYAEGGARPGAPAWMTQMAAFIPSRCGRVDLTVELLARQYESTEDPRVREELGEQLAAYRAVSEVQYLSGAVAAFKERAGGYPASLAQLVRSLRPAAGAPNLRLSPAGAPLDPHGVPYRYDPSTGVVDTDPASLTLPSIDATTPSGAR